MDLKQKITQLRADGYYGVDEKIALAYLETLEAHIRFVREAGQLVGAWDKLLAVHDESKFGREEFAGYAIHFQGGGAPNLFADAWLNHCHLNKHHWQHWLFPDGFSVPNSDMESGCVLMPALYVQEMLSDWLGAGMAYTGSWDMRDWLAKNLPKIKLHSRSRNFLNGELVKLGYEEVVRACLLIGT